MPSPAQMPVCCGRRLAHRCYAHAMEPLQAPAETQHLQNLGPAAAVARTAARRQTTGGPARRRRPKMVQLGARSTVHDLCWPKALAENWKHWKCLKVAAQLLTRQSRPHWQRQARQHCTFLQEALVDAASNQMLPTTTKEVA